MERWLKSDNTSSFPWKRNFSIRFTVVSEVLSSNGSTSMGSVCGSTLSLLDAGVPLKAPVSGTAMGLIKKVKKYEYLQISRYRRFSW